MKKFPVGTCAILSANPEDTFKRAADLGITDVQLICLDGALQTDEMSEKILAAKAKYGMKIYAYFWSGASGPGTWDMYEGQRSLGLIPAAYRAQRLKEMIDGAAFAHKLGIRDVITHVGFTPENPLDPAYSDLVTTLRYYCQTIKENGQRHLFETGQETPITLLRLIQDIGTGNAGINLDTGNLVLWGKANPADALYVFGKYVWQCHCKDARYPTDPRYMGEEVKMGTGHVDFKRVVAGLRELDFQGALIIEREVSDSAEQARDILEAKAYLESL